VRVLVEDVSQTYVDRRGHAVHALDAVSLDVGSQEFVALLGPSGCGKSTLLNIVAGLLRPTRGTVAFEGAPADGRALTAMVFQEFGLEEARMPAEERARRVRGPIELTGLGNPLIAATFPISRIALLRCSSSGWGSARPRTPASATPIRS
jgi:NitT/TauT family transport system ATP-binding protein